MDPGAIVPVIGGVATTLDTPPVYALERVKWHTPPVDYEFSSLFKTELVDETPAIFDIDSTVEPEIDCSMMMMDYQENDGHNALMYNWQFDGDSLPSAAVAQQADDCFLNELSPIDCTEQNVCILRALSHDHAYLDKSSEDYQVLSEFLELGDVLGADAQQEDMLKMLAEDIDIGLIGNSPGFFDTFDDLTPYLNGANQQIAESTTVDDVAEEKAPIDETSEISGDDSVADFSTTTAASVGSGRDSRYIEKRRKNNIASARSRLTRKQRALETERERMQLEARNAFLKQQIELLTASVEKHRRLLLENLQG